MTPFTQGTQRHRDPHRTATWNYHFACIPQQGHIRPAPTTNQTHAGTPPNLTWWDNHEYTELYEHRQTTLLHTPRTVHDEILHLKGRLLQQIAHPDYHHEKQHPDTPRLWKILLHFDRLLLARPPQQPNSRQSGQSHAALVRQRLHLYNTGQWALLHQQHDPTHTTPQPPATQTKLGKTISTLIRQGELSRAMSLLISPGRITTDAERAADIANFHHSDPTPNPHHTSHAPAQIDALLPHIAATLKSLPARKMQGPEASRNEHWRPLRHYPQYLRALAQITQLIASGNLPPDALRAILTTTLTAKLKPAQPTAQTHSTKTSPRHPHTP